jgi:hydroxymethylglutaryl-CoA synthase
MSDQPVGIVAYGSYIPPTRLPLAMIHGGRMKEGGPQKAVAGFDEDALTMAVAAAIDCLASVDRNTVDGVYFATTTSPFREKQAATFIARALDLRCDISQHRLSPAHCAPLPPHCRRRCTRCRLIRVKGFW